MRNVPECFFGLLRVIIFVLFLFSYPASAKQDVRPLFPQTSTEGEIKGGETHSYQISSAAGQFIFVQVATLRSAQISMHKEKRRQAAFHWSAFTIQEERR